MKIFRFTLSSFVLTVFLLGWVGTSAAARSLWPKKHGELCWETGAPGELVRLYVTNMGNGHYLVLGSVAENGNIQAVHGNAELVGEEVIMHVTASGSDEYEVFGFQGSVALDLSTLDGTADGISLSCDKTTNVCELNYDGEVALDLVPCP
jgi:hypothetical protein